MRFILLSLLFIALNQANAQEAYKPSHQELIASYKRSAMLDTTASKKVFHSYVRPNWAPDGKSFWYRVSTGYNTADFMVVNAVTNKKDIAFDHEQLAKAFNKLTNKNVRSGNLPIEDMVIKPGKPDMMFLSNKVWYNWNNGGLTVMATPPKIVIDPAERWRRRNSGSRELISPDKKSTAYIKDGNVFVKTDGVKEDAQLTTDGKTGNEYGRLSWSPDGKNLIGYKIDVKEVKKVYYILSSQPDTFRGELKSQEYMQPGDDFTSYEMYVFNLQKKAAKKVDIDKIDFFGPPQLHWRKGDNNIFTFERRDRGHQRFRVIEVNTNTGATKNIIDEMTNTFIYEQKIFTEYLPDTHEIVWQQKKMVTDTFIL